MWSGGAMGKLIDTVTAACARLAPAGWKDLLAAHGLDITAADLHGALLEPLTGIDRTLPGFEDFAAEGTRGIEPGRPAQSLLLHAFASPNVVSGTDGFLRAFPTPDEIAAVENLVFGIRTPSLAEVAAQFPGQLGHAPADPETKRSTPAGTRARPRARSRPRIGHPLETTSGVRLRVDSPHHPQLLLSRRVTLLRRVRAPQRP